MKQNKLFLRFIKLKLDLWFIFAYICKYENINKNTFCMKRGIFFLGFSMIIIVTAYAQSLSLSWTGGAINNEQTITVTGDTIGTVYSYVNCKNDTSSTVTVRVRKKEISVVSGSENTFCWVNCYLPNIFTSPFSIDILADSVAHDFSGEYKAKGNIGITTIMYTFFNVADENDSVCVLVAYDCSLGSAVPEISDETIEFSNAYPNPANTFTSLSYSVPASEQNSLKIIIRDLVGNIISENILTDKEGTLKIFTEKFSDGVYFYSLIIDDQVFFTRKLIVRH